MRQRQFRHCAGGVLVALALLASPVQGQGLAGRPIRVLVPVAPGGPSDTVMRLVLPRLSEALKQTIVVDNRPSNNGVAGTEIAARANPDGYTLAIGNSGTHAVNASLYRKLPYDPVRDFAPISQMVTSGMILVATPRFAPNSLAELISAARKAPEKINVAVAGATGEIAGEALMAMTQMRLNNVRYKGSSPAELAILSGEVEVTLLTPLASVQHINAGKLKAYGISSSRRSSLLPGVPTIAEAGVPGYDFQIWHGIFAPKGTADRVIRVTHGEVVKALNAPDVRERLNQLGFEIIGSSPEEFSKVLVSEVAKFRKVVNEAGIRIE